MQDKNSQVCSEEHTWNDSTKRKYGVKHSNCKWLVQMFLRWSAKDPFTVVRTFFRWLHFTSALPNFLSVRVGVTATFCTCMTTANSAESRPRRNAVLTISYQRNRDTRYKATSRSPVTAWCGGGQLAFATNWNFEFERPTHYWGTWLLVSRVCCITQLH